VFELLIEVLGEFILQVLGEAFLELGFHSLAEPFRKPPDPWIAALGYTLFGCIFGGLSLLAFAAHLTPAGVPRLLNLLLTPLAVGLCMVALGRWRARRGDSVLRIDRFFYGYLFALGFALVRFSFAQ
jgi:hypothetical protein